MSFSVGDDRTAAGFGSPTGPGGGLEAGDVVAGRFRLMELLGEGGMGLVWKAADVDLKELVALKIVRPELMAHEGARDRFLKEIQVLRRLRHPGIVEVHELVKDAQRSLLGYTMQLLEGRSLRARIKECPEGLPVEEARRIFDELLTAIGHAHGEGVIHRDLKPENLFLTESGLKVLDFGLAKTVATTAMTLTGAGLGTVTYVAPEQKRDAGKADERSDIYSLGIVLYELLTGKVPEGAFDPVSELREDVGAKLDKALRRCLKPEPGERWQSLEGLKEALEPAWSPAAPLSARALSAPSSVLALEKVASRRAVDSDSEPRRRERGARGSWRAGVLVIIGVLLLAVAGGVSVVVVDFVTSRREAAAEKTKAEAARKARAEAAAEKAKAEAARKARAEAAAAEKAKAEAARKARAEAAAAAAEKARAEAERKARAEAAAEKAKAEAARKARAILADRDRWKAASAELQDAAVSWVAQKLGSAYAHVRTKTYRCGGESHRLATFKHKATGLELNLIPGGRFRMGSTGGDDDEKPVHTVTVKPMLIGRTEVTQAVWAKLGGKTIREQRDLANPDFPIRGEGASHPIYYVSWNEVTAWLGKAGEGLRLPSEAEWESACRAGTTTKWSFGDDESGLSRFAWYDSNSGDKTHPVGKKDPNAFGLHDMHGNVWEWCLDHWHGSYEGAPTDGSAWTTGGDAAWRVLRGGSWDISAGYARTADRIRYISEYLDSNFGFRVARGLD